MELRLNGIVFFFTVLSVSMSHHQFTCIACSPDFCYFSFSAIAVRRKTENYKKTSTLLLNWGSSILNRSSHPLSCYFENFRET